MWVSIRRKNLPPFIIGIYYGKQETRTKKDQIETEIQLLNEEIEEMKREGHILLAMDGNAKIGILGEDISRNGHLILQSMENTELHIMNTDERCTGKVTRQNTKNINEVSAIDFIIADETMKQWIKSIEIDESGLYKIRGKNESDHNSISISLDIPNLD